MRRFSGFTAVALLGWASSAEAIVTSYQLGSHVVAPGESAYGVDLSGVVMIGGLAPDGDPIASCSGALITDRHVLSAAHCFDEDGDGQVDSLLELFPHEVLFESSAGYTAIAYEIDSIQWPPQWPDQRGDLAVITLVEEAPAWAPRYALYAGDAEVGRPLVLAGYGKPGHGSAGEDESASGGPALRAGRNRYEAIRDDYEGVDFLAYDFDSGMEEQNALAQIEEVESDLGFGPDEVNSAKGDSGGASFINGAVAAVTAFGARLSVTDVTDDVDSSWGELSFDTRVSKFRDFILEATDGQALFVFDGDYTKNGAVDGHDFLLWQRQYAAVDFPAADGNGDGTVTEADYELWLDNFGRSTGTSASHAVPEPAAAIMLLGSFLSLLFVRRRRVVCR